MSIEKNEYDKVKIDLNDPVRTIELLGFQRRKNEYILANKLDHKSFEFVIRDISLIENNLQTSIIASLHGNESLMNDSFDQLNMLISSLKDMSKGILNSTKENQKEKTVN